MQTWLWNKGRRVTSILPFKSRLKINNIIVSIVLVRIRCETCITPALCVYQERALAIRPTGVVHTTLLLPTTTLLRVLHERFEVYFESRARQIQFKLGDDFWVENADLADAVAAEHHVSTTTREVGSIWRRNTQRYLKLYCRAGVNRVLQSNSDKGNSSPIAPPVRNPFKKAIQFGWWQFHSIS